MSRARLIVFGILALALVLSAAGLGCKKPEPARLMVQVEGELFSDAFLSINGKQTGKLTRTLIKADGQLSIDGAPTVKLPPGHRDIPQQDQYSGTLDSLEITSGTYMILLQTQDGKSLQIKASLKPGLNIVDYNSDEQIVKWNNQKISAAPGTTVTLP